MSKPSLEHLKYPVGIFEYKPPTAPKTLASWIDTIALFPSRLEEAIANTQNNLEQAVASQNGFESSGLADLLSNSVNGRFVVASPEENLRIFNIALETISTDTLLEAFLSYWTTNKQTDS